jgi:DNA-binding transcriptional regulator YdaS (Cro superfamily)
MTAVAVTPGTVDEQIGALVHQLMWQNRITQKTMADLLGIQQSAMSRKLRGGRPWLAAEVARVAYALGVAPGDLMPASSAPPSEPLTDADMSTTRRNSTGELNAVVGVPQLCPSPRTATAIERSTSIRSVRAA